MAPEDVVSQMFGVPRSTVSDSTSNRTLEEWDSLGHMNLILELEATYDLSISPEDAMEMTDVASIKKLLRGRGAAW